MKKLLVGFYVSIALLLPLVIAAVAYAQARSVVIDFPDADAAAVAGVVRVLPDAGCSLRVLYGGPINGFAPAPQDYPFNGNRCAVVTNALQRAAERDLAVGDGGVP